MSRTTEDNRKQVEQQMGWLVRSIHSYERGNIDEAPRIAVTVANLVYSSGQPNSRRGTVSVLDRLGQQSAIAFTSTGMVERDGNLMPDHPLVDGPFGPEGREFRPQYMIRTWDRNSMTGYQFDAWWTMPIYKTPGYVNLPDGVSINRQAALLSRKDVIMTLRNQDGGAHYDDEIKNAAYSTLRKEGTNWAITKSDGTVEPIEGMIEAMAAQIGWELMSTLLTHFRDIPTSIGR